MRIRVVVTGRFYHAAEALPETLELADGASIDDALACVNELLPGDAPLPASCLVAVSGRHLGTVAHHSAQELAEDDELVLLSPVAGG